MDKTQAWELLNNPEHCGRLNIVGLRDLMLRAGYSGDAVQQAIKKHGLDRLSNDMVM